MHCASIDVRQEHDSLCASLTTQKSDDWLLRLRGEKKTEKVVAKLWKILVLKEHTIAVDSGPNRKNKSVKRQASQKKRRFSK